MRISNKKILNPKTGRYVLKTGVIGKKILENRRRKRRSKPRKRKSKPRKKRTNIIK